MSERHVVVVAFPGVQPLDAVGPIEVFAGATRAARALGRDGGYRVTLASSGRAAGEVARAGSDCAPVPLPEPGEPIDTLVLAGGSGTPRRGTTPTLISWIRAVAPTLPAGDHGLHGRVPRRRGRPPRWASGHHPLGQRGTRLGAEFPSISVDPDPIYIRDGKYWTSAGVTAGIDLALALVQEDLGVDVAQTVARWLVMFLHRPGGPDAVRLPGMGAAGRALDRTGRAGAGRVRTRR